MKKAIKVKAKKKEEESLVLEVCPHCESEIEMKWNLRKRGFKSYCPVCGKTLMLCGECLEHGDETESKCDYNSKTKTCKFNRRVILDHEEVIKVKLDKNAILPTRAHDTDAGYDLYAPFDFQVPCSTATAEDKSRGAKMSVCVNIGCSFVDTGVHIELPKKTVGMIKSKSGLNVKNGLTAEGVIDEGYTGSIGVKLYNHTCEPYQFKRGDKIAQLVILPIRTPALDEVEELKETDRGNNGFGSTGR